MADRQIYDHLAPSLNKIPDTCNVQSIKLAEIAGPHVDSQWLFEQLGFLLSTEIWNTFGSWITNENPELSSVVEYNLHGYAEAANRKEIQGCLHTKKHFKTEWTVFFCGDKILCFPTTVDLPPRLNEITPDFLEGDYIPRAMGVNAISSLSRTPQITIPVAEVNGVPIGLSFIAGYGQDMMLEDFCNGLYRRCFL